VPKRRWGQTRSGCVYSLDEAIVRGDTDIVKLLIKHGADVNVVADSNQCPAVARAAVPGHGDIVQQLLVAGAALDTEQQLMVVRKCCDSLEDARAVKVVRLLLPDCTSFTDSNYELGGAMLTAAVFTGKLHVDQILHDAGATARTCDHNGDLMHNAAGSGSLAVVKWLQSLGLLMHNAAGSGSLAVVKWLQSLGLDARALSDHKQLPLHWACQHKHVHIANYLLDLPGAADDIHARCKQKGTPLHYAASNEADSVVELLLRRDADANVRDGDGQTPLMMAKSLAAAKLLLAAGADAAAVTDRGTTVLHCQAQRGACAGSICLLLKAGADPTVAPLVDGTCVSPAHVAGMSGFFCY
jgi:ankyrin repeat protein